jgi:adenosylmethionine-8-amino-7-oxononanoate aminotransferase
MIAQDQSKVFHRRSNRTMPMAVGGEGVYLIGANGKRYLDASAGGAGINTLGYSHPKVIDAMQRQLETLPFIHGALFTTEPLEELAALLVDQAPAGLDRAFFVSGGTEGIEIALLLARQYAVESGQPDRRLIISRRNSYHGSSFTSFGVGDAAARRAPFDPMLSQSAKISPSYPYRHQRINESDDQYVARIADELDAAIIQAGPGNTLAFIAETVGGSTSGALPTLPGYFQRIRQICDRHGVLLILDEVFSGMGRIGSLYGCSMFDVVPDILVVAKGLAAGYSPAGAVLASKAIHDTIAQGSGTFKAGFTNSGHTATCAAALATQRALIEENILDNVQRQGARLRSALQDRFGNHRFVGDIRGHGLAQAIEIVADRSSKSPFDPRLGLSAKIAEECLKRELICLPAGGTIDGRQGEHVMIAPPLIIEDHQVDAIVSRLGDALDAACAD